MSNDSSITVTVSHLNYWDATKTHQLFYVMCCVTAMYLFWMNMRVAQTPQHLALLFYDRCLGHGPRAQRTDTLRERQPFWSDLVQHAPIKWTELWWRTPQSTHQKMTVKVSKHSIQPPADKLRLQRPFAHRWCLFSAWWQTRLLAFKVFSSFSSCLGLSYSVNAHVTLWTSPWMLRRLRLAVILASAPAKDHLKIDVKMKPLFN